MSGQGDQWIRKVGLILFSDQNGLDLSEFHIRFEVTNSDQETLNAAAIRVYNLSKPTLNRIVNGSEFQSVSLNAGYINGNYGTIFQGTIRQYRIGKENAVDSYVDILASDGDLAYNGSVVNASIAAGATTKEHLDVLGKSMNSQVDYGAIKTTKLYQASIRGKTLYGLSKFYLRNEVDSLDSTWSIQNGVVQIIQNNGYLEGEAVVLNSATGLIGIPEQTGEGIRAKCLLNSKLRIGGLIEINNSTLNQTTRSQSARGTTAYNSRSALQPIAPLSDDGVYRLMVAEHEGDTRGTAWYTHIVALAFDKTNSTTLAP